MKRLGFIHDMMDVKVLILFVAARANSPMTVQEIYELCYQDECLSYFEVCDAIPQLVESGHLQLVGEDTYAITEKGKQHGDLTENSIAFTVKQKAENAVDRFNRQLRLKSFVKTQIQEGENGDYSVAVSLDDEMGNLMKLQLMAPNQRQAIRLQKLLERKAENVYNLAIMELLDEEDSLTD